MRDVIIVVVRFVNGAPFTGTLTYGEALVEILPNISRLVLSVRIFFWRKWEWDSRKINLFKSKKSNLANCLVQRNLLMVSYIFLCWGSVEEYELVVSGIHFGFSHQPGRNVRRNDVDRSSLINCRGCVVVTNPGWTVGQDFAAGEWNRSGLKQKIGSKLRMHFFYPQLIWGWPSRGGLEVEAWTDNSLHSASVGLNPV